MPDVTFGQYLADFEWLRARSTKPEFARRKLSAPQIPETSRKIWNGCSSGNSAMVAQCTLVRLMCHQDQPLGSLRSKETGCSARKTGSVHA